METNQRFEFIVSTLVRYRNLWIIPAIAGMLLAGVYVFVFKANTWTAKQSLIVRDDLLGQSYKPGQFNSQESMKSAQETILEIARKPEVIRKTLQQLGPPSTGWLGGTSSEYPSDEVVEDVQGMISFSAPNGGEFGKTEVIILNTRSTSPERSREFIEILLDEMDTKISEVRTLRLESMADELTRIRDAAAASLRNSSNKLREMEKHLGSDVSTMHGLNSSSSGEGIKLEISQIRLEKRVVEAELESARNSQEMVITARLNPEKTLATSSEFLSTQPTLQALQQSLVEAQKNYAVHVGSNHPIHPLVISSRETIIAMRHQIYLELETLERSVASRIKMLENKIHRLSQLEYEENERLAQLGTQRVDHLTLNAEVTKKTEVVNNAYSELAEIEAQRNAAAHVNWLTRVDSPQVSTRPDGLGKKHTILAGGICGLILGIGLVMLVAPPMVPPHQGRPGRRTDLPRRGNEESLASPTLNEMVGPTAASAIQTASAATAATVNKGVSLAKSAFGSNSPEKDENSESVNIPHIQPTRSESRPASPVSKSESPVSKSGNQATQDSKKASLNSPKASAPPANNENEKKPAEPVKKVAKAEIAPAKSVPAKSVPANPAEPVARSVNTRDAKSEADHPASTETAATPMPSAAEILAQVRANAADKQPQMPTNVPRSQSTVAKSDDGSESPPTPAATSEAAASTGKRSIKLDTSRGAKIQRTSNVRPVDLARSADDGSTTFLQIPRREEATTQPIDDFMATIQPIDNKSAENENQATGGMPNLDNDSPAEQQGNPFLKHLPTRRSNPPTEGSQQPEVKSADAKKPPMEEDPASTSSTARSEAPTMPIPDQIKNLADSIANFAKPLKTDPPKKDDPNF